MAAPEQSSRYEQSRDAALALFAKKGYGQVSMRELASHIGMQAGSLYHHFPSKQHLLFDLVEEFYEERQAMLLRRSRALRPGERALTAVIRAHLALYRDKPLHLLLVERDSCCLSDDQLKRVNLLRQQYEQLLLTLLGANRPAAGPRWQLAGRAIANLLQSVPSGLQDQPLSDTELTALMEDLLTGAIERTLQGLGRQASGTHQPTAA